MSDLEEIQSVGRTADEIPRADVMRWMKSSDLHARAALFDLVDNSYDRITPELGFDARWQLSKTYFLRCIKESTQADELIFSDYEAARYLVAWIKYLDSKKPEANSWIVELSKELTLLFRESDESVRNCIVCGFLEHAFERQSIRQWFSSWLDDSELKESYLAAARWGDHHLDDHDGNNVGSDVG